MEEPKRSCLWFLVALILVVWIMVTPGCGGTGAIRITGSTVPLPAGATRLTSGGFTASILPETYVGGGAVRELELMHYTKNHQVVVELSARGAQGLKAMFVEIAYESQRYHAQQADLSAALTASPELLRLDMLADPGLASSGQVIAAYENSPGVDGDLVLLRLVFEPGPCAATHRTSTPPGADASQAELFYDTADGLHWYFTCAGDNNQDSTVAIADLAPLGQKFGQVSSGGAGVTFAVDDWRDLIDGSRDGAINIADLAAIGVNWGNRAFGYRVYSSTDLADYPASNTGTNGAGAEMADELLLAEASGAAGERKHFFSALPAPDAAAYYWVRPFDDTGEGTPSEARQPGQLDKEPPYWVDQTYIGIQAAIAKDGKVRVMYGGAEDALSPPVDYTVYYSEGAAVDFATAQTQTITDQTRIVDISGLVNGTQYAFAVRAKDRAAVPNEELNAVVLTATPQPYTDMPAVISADVDYPGPVRIPLGQSTVLSNGARITCQNDLLIEGMLSAYDNDINLNVAGDLILTGQLVLDTPEDDVPDGTEGHSINIVAQSHMFINQPDDPNPLGSISSRGNLQIVNDPSNLVTPEDGINDTDNDLNPELYPFNLMPESGLKRPVRIADVVRNTSSTQYYGPSPWQWYVSGKWGTVPTPPRGVTRILLRIYQNDGQIVFDNFSITGPKGRKGKSGTGCNAVGGAGSDAFRLRIHASKKLTYNNVTINLGDGGDGGDATTPPCCDGTAIGGAGGQPGKFRITAGEEISCMGTFNLNPGKGGNGGPATAIGDDGEPGCPGDPGCNGTATGGAGASTHFGISVRGNVTGIGSVTLGPARGGNGGIATATGGNGGETTCACTDGAPGGYGTAIGGDGGDANFGSTAGAGGGGATGGNGGTASASGGDGSDGTGCYKAPGGNGGDGGDASATGGGKGTASGTGTLTDGSQGAAYADGGDGGDGGDGCPPGSGGEGGTGTASGSSVLQSDGDPGANGVENPPGCVVMLCLQGDTLVPDPTTPGMIPAGFAGTATVVNHDTAEVLGNVPYSWFYSPGANISWDHGTEGQMVFTIENSSPDPAGLSVTMGEGEWMVDTETMTGARLGVRMASNMGGTDVGYMQTLDATKTVTGSFTIPVVPLIPSGPSLNIDWPCESFFDIYYQIEILPQSTVILDCI